MRLGFSRSHLVMAVLSLSFSGGACGSKADPAAEPDHASKPSAAEGTSEAIEAPKKNGATIKPRPTSTGVTLTLTIDGQESTLKINVADLEGRAKGSALAVFNCTGILGDASITDFRINSDPARKGELFSASVSRKDLGEPPAGKPVAGRIEYRRAGEPAQTKVEANATWDEGLMSGSAEGTGKDGKVVKLSWACDPVE